MKFNFLQSLFSFNLANISLINSIVELYIYIRNKIKPTFILLLLTGCFFSPIYSDFKTDIYEDLRLELNEKGDKLLNNKFKIILSREFNSNFDSKDSCYLLKVSVEKSYTEALKSDAGYSARDNVFLYVNYVLIDECEKNKEITRGRIKSVDSVYISESRFTNYNSKEFAAENLMELAAKELNMRLRQIDL